MEVFMDIEKIRAYFARDRFLTAAGITIDEAGDGYGVCSMEIRDLHLNASDVVQGGATFTLSDSAFAVACNAADIDAGENRITVGQAANINYFKPGRGKRLIAVAKRVSGGRKTSVYQIEITDEVGTKVAMMIGNAYTVDLK
jgi:acyl-CoA thioesterase